MSDKVEQNPLLRWYRNTPDRQRRRTGLMLLVVCFVVLLFRSFLDEPHVVKTALQVDFEHYVEQREQAVQSGHGTDLVLPRIHVVIESDGVTPAHELIVEPAAGDEPDLRILRLLSLAREAKVFAVNRKASAAGQGIRFRVEDGEHEFSTNLRRSDVHDNIQAETLLKLLTIHGKPVV